MSLTLFMSCGNKEAPQKNEGTQSNKMNNKDLSENLETKKLENMNNQSFYNFEINSLNGEAVDLTKYKGKRLLLVNTASECGLTPQYKQLQELYDSLGGDSFEIIGFPANNFGSQEPGSNSDIQTFCTQNFGVTFPMMSKISVKGDDVHPLYKWLIDQERAKSGDKEFEPLWNFHKFLIDENGNYVKQIHPETLPTDTTIVNWILS